MLKVTKRNPVNSTVIFTDHKANNTCLSLLPLEVDCNLWFSLPNSEEIIRYSSEISFSFIQHSDSNSTQQIPSPNLFGSDKANPFLFSTLFMYCAQKLCPLKSVPTPIPSTGIRQVRKSTTQKRYRGGHS